jgi:oligopeptidase B
MGDAGAVPVPASRPPAPPPRPPSRPKTLEAHGDRRVDEWWWLRDRDDPVVLEHLRAENAFTDASLSHLEPFRRAVFDEMVSRIAETDHSTPVRDGPWWYFERTRQGLGYPLHCRCPAGEGVEPPPDPSERPEQVILDENRLADGHHYLHVGTFALSPDHRWLAYGVDTAGDERFELRFADLSAGAGADLAAGAGALIEAPEAPEAAETLPDTSYGLAWGLDGVSVFYTRPDAANRPFQLWRHTLGRHPGTDELVLQEDDERFSLGVGLTRDEAFVLVAVQSTTTSELWAIPAARPRSAPLLLEPRRSGHEYDADHYPGPDQHPGWWVILTNDGAEDFRVMVTPEDEPGRAGWTEVVPHREGVRVDGVQLFDGWMVLEERIDGERRVRTIDLSPPAAPGAQNAPDARLGPFHAELLARSALVESDERPATTWTGANREHAAPWVRCEQTSLITPRTVVDVDLGTGRRHVRRRQPVLGGFRRDDYVTARLWASAPDGVAVPISVAHHKDLLATSGSGAERAEHSGGALSAPAPCLLYGYGAYEHAVDPVFSSLRLSLLERGFVFAIAHVRGGGELGRHWYEDGKLSRKHHSFEDFVACARHLVSSGFTTPAQLVARGASAGGMLIGAVLNAAPTLFRAAVAEVPFVDCLTTMLDPSLPLTVGEWEEWGDPVTDPAAYAWLKSYSPYDNVRALDDGGRPLRYPDILATAGLNDPRVGYWEPAKWVARIRAANTQNRVLLRTELEAGHGGPSGRYEAWWDEALVLTFVLDAVGKAAPSVGGAPGSP